MARARVSTATDGEATRRAKAARASTGSSAGSSAADEPASLPDPQMVVISGLSGAGKSQASKLLEDLGYFCVDNLPPELVDSFLSLREVEPERFRRVALMLDIRAGDPAAAIRRARADLRNQKTAMQIIYLEADDSTLISRFSETRHRHPLQERSGVQASITKERRRLEETRELADHVIDTSDLSIAQLRERLFAVLPRNRADSALQIDLITFGFKYGIPLEADLVFDVRFLTNPFWVPDLKPLTGLQPPVRDFVLNQPAAGRFLDLVAELLTLTVPAYRAEGKGRLSVALGCTGGHHRSIAIAEELAVRLRGVEDTSVAVFHRELEQ